MFRILLGREVTSLFSSAYSFFFALVFLLANGLMLWLFSGSFNILDNGYATLERFFTFSSFLLVLLVPALTMRSFSEEQLTKTLYLQYSRPLSITELYLSKCLAILLFLILIIVSTLIYVYTIYILGSPVGNIDFDVLIVSYTALFAMAVVFVFWGVFASCLSKYSIVGFILSLLINFTIFFGFDLLSNLFNLGTIQYSIKSLGLSFHFQQLQRGVVQFGDVLIFINYILIAWICTVFLLRFRNKSEKHTGFLILGCLFLLNILSFFLPADTRIDFTKDRRYTIQDSSKELLTDIAAYNKDIKINIYLEGDLNYSFLRLRDATQNLLSDFNRYADQHLSVSFINPNSLPVSFDKLPQYMADQGLPPITLNEKNRDGKISQQLIYPYAQVIYDHDTLQIPLLKNLKGNTAEENLNASIENLEFEFIDALHLLVNNEEQHIAFIEGHGELPRAYIYDVEEALSKYFYVNRGEIGNDISILDDFRAVIIAGPKERFNEAEKYILDQYIMKGGRVLWLIDGAYVSEHDLQNKGQSASIKNDTNLDDLLFTYGIRVNSNLLQDAQCSEVLLNNGENSQTVTAPWYYSPILLPTINHPITKNIADVKSSLISDISIVKTSDEVHKDILLTTSENSHIVQIPEMIDFNFQKISSDEKYFNESFLAVALALNGEFASSYLNRLIPDSIVSNGYKTILKSKPTKMVVVSSSDIIKNDIVGKGNDTQVLPLGYDRVSGRQYGNKEFIVNAVNWLVNDNDRLILRNNKRQIDLLNKQLIYENRDKYVMLNITLPLLFMGFVLGCIIFYRKYKYSK